MAESARAGSVHVVVRCVGEEQAPPGLEPLGELADVVYARSTEELARTIARAEILFVADFRSSDLAEVWDRRGPLRWVHSAATGVDALLFPALAESDVVLTNSRGVFDQPLAEYVLGLMLAFAKDLPTTLALQTERRWRHRESERLADTKLLVVGAGPIGRRIGSLSRCLGMEVVLVGRSARDDREFGHVYAASELDSLLPGADWVVLAVPLTAETEGMFGAPQLAAMKSSARLVNVGRGALVDEAALIEAMHKGRIAGAALDAFLEEPLPEASSLWELPGVIVSPHMSGDFVGWRRALSELFLGNLHRWQAGEPLRNVVDKRLGFVASDE